MMNSFRRSSERETSSLRRAMLATLLVVCVGVIDVFLGGALRSSARDALAPFGDSVTRLAKALLHYTDISSRVALLDRIVALESELVQAKERDALVQFVLQENNELRKLANAPDASVAIVAPVASSIHASPFGTFIIARGAAAGVMHGALVFTPEGFLLGTVADVGERSATVRLLFAPEAQLDVIADEYAFLLTGKGLLQAHGQVPVEMPLLIGTVVSSPEHAGAPVGVISHIATSSASVYSDIFVTLPTNIATVRHVRVSPNTP